MGIYQALIGSYPSASVASWEIFSYPAGFNTISASNLQANDLVVFALGRDSGSGSVVGPTTTALINNTSINSITVLVRYLTVPATPADIGYFTFADYGLVLVFRNSGSTSSNISVEATHTTTSSPGHNNTAVAFSEGDLALLLAYIDDDATPMTPPTDSTKIAEDQNSGNGTIGAAYKEINTAGNYSWGSWTTTTTDNTVAYVIKIQES